MIDAVGLPVLFITVDRISLVIIDFMALIFFTFNHF